LMSHDAAERPEGSLPLVVGQSQPEPALLSGLLICGACGRRMRTGYRHSDHPFYDCAREREEAREPTCCGLSASAINELVVRQVLKALEPAAVAPR
jgi:hypothetical protein